MDRGNYIRGITTMATLLPKGPDGAIRGIAAIGFDHHMTEKALQQIRASLLEAARSTAAQVQ